MAFPVVQARASGASGTSNVTSHSITLPSGVVAGDLLIVVFSSDGSPTVSTTSNGWVVLSQLVQSGLQTTGAVLSKRATGSDALTVTTSFLEQSSHISLRISDGAVRTVASANGDSTNSDPPSCNPAITDDYLWIATRGGDVSTGFINATAAPSNYSNLTTKDASGVLGAATATAERSLNASSENPGTFTSGDEQWVCFTIAVAPLNLLASGTGTAYDATASTLAGGVPTDIAGLTGWFKGDAITPQTDNTQFEVWPDSNGGSATEQPFSLKPLYRTSSNGINGLAAAQFGTVSGAPGDTALRTADGVTGGGSVTVFAAIRPSAVGAASDNTSRTIWCGDGGSLKLRIFEGKLSWVRVGGSMVCTGSTTLSTSTTYLVCGVFDSTGSAAIYLNRASDGTTTHSTSLTASTYAYFGGSGIFGGERYEGLLGETFWFNSVLSASDRTVMFTYLGRWTATSPASTSVVLPRRPARGLILR